MMNSKKKTKGFSLAELLISLLIISIVLAAAIPTITKKNKAGEKTWHYTGTNNAVYSAIRSNQSVILGADKIPFSDKGYAERNRALFNDDTVFPDTVLASNDFKQKVSQDTDKLVILKKTLPGLSNLTNSQISFFTLNEGVSTTDPNRIHYAGRLSADRHNLALGIASLQSFNTTEADTTGTSSDGKIHGYNTALGHHTLTFNSTGMYNTAVGEKAIARNIIGQHNTAMGYWSLMNLTGIGAGTPGSESLYSNNTALGSMALANVLKGKSNTSIGASSLRGTTEGNYNTAIGYDACSNLQGSYNICLGYSAGAMDALTDSTRSKTKFFNEQNQGLDNSKYALNIGVSRVDNSDGVYTTDHDTPLITGVLQSFKNGVGSSGTRHKSLTVNATEFNVNAFNGVREVFKVRSALGNMSNPYQVHQPLISDVFFNLRDTYGIASDKSSILLSLAGVHDGGSTAVTTDKRKKLLVLAMDKYNTTDSAHLADINLNNRLTIEYNDIAGTNGYSEVKLHTKHYARPNGTTPNYAYLNFDNVMSIYNKPEGTAKMTLWGVGKPSERATNPIFDGGTEANNVKYFNLHYDGINRNFLTNVYATYQYSRDKHVVKTNKFEIQGSGSNPLVNVYTPLLVTANGSEFSGSGVGLYPSGGSDPADVVVWTQGGGPEAHISLRQVFRDVVNLNATVSDARLKDVSGDSTAGLKEINALQVKNFTYKRDKEKKPQVGVIAQELQKIFPNSVITDAEGYLRIKTQEIFYAMVNSIKELSAMLQDLTAKVVGLDKRITELEQQNKLLKEQNEAFEKRLEKLEKQMAK